MHRSRTRPDVTLRRADCLLCVMHACWTSFIHSFIVGGEAVGGGGGAAAARGAPGRAPAPPGRQAATPAPRQPLSPTVSLSAFVLPRQQFIPQLGFLAEALQSHILQPCYEVPADLGQQCSVQRNEERCACDHMSPSSPPGLLAGRSRTQPFHTKIVHAALKRPSRLFPTHCVCPRRRAAARRGCSSAAVRPVTCLRAVPGFHGRLRPDLPGTFPGLNPELDAFKCTAFPNDAVPTDRIITSLIMTAIALPTKLVLERMFELASEAPAPAIRGSASGARPRRFSGR